MSIVIFVLYMLSFVVAISVMRSRAGTGWWYGLKIFGRDGFGVVWVSKIGFLAFLWPITLIVWLLRGRPEPRVVFNEKAAERERARAEQLHSTG